MTNRQAPMDPSQNLTGRIRRTPQNLKCSVCAREFLPNRKADLDRHMRIHTNEKPYKCDYLGCDKAFRQSSALKTHVNNVHTKELRYSCDMCSRDFCDKPTRNRHKKEQHTMNYIYQCPFLGCDGKKIKRRDTFRKHALAKHDTTMTDEEAAKHRVRSTHTAKPAINKAKSASPQVADPGLLPSAPIMPGFAGRPSSSSSSSAHSYRPSTHSVPLQNPYVSPRPSSSPYSEHSPAPARQYTMMRYGSPGDVPQMAGNLPYTSLSNTGYAHHNYGTSYAGTQYTMSPSYSPTLSPASLASYVSTSSGSISSTSSLHSSHGSPRPVISRSNSLSPAQIDPHLRTLPADPYGKVTPVYHMAPTNNNFDASSALHF